MDSKKNTSDIQTDKEVYEDANSYIIKIPPGKIYLGESKPETQKNQQGNTCWFYASSVLRLRLGKQLETKIEDNKALVAARNNEKKISQYRKDYEEIDRNISVASNLDTEIKVNLKIQNGEVSRKHVEQAILVLSSMLKAEKKEDERKQLELQILILKQFLTSPQSSYADFKDFINKKYTLDKMELADKTLESLGQKDKLNSFAKKMFPDKKFHELELRDQSVIHQRVVSSVSSELLGYKFSEFNPANNFDGLRETLKKEGAIQVSGLFGRNRYTENPTLKEKNKELNYDVYAWKPGTAKPQNTNEMFHSIIIVGVQKTPQETVLFIDPNDPSEPGKNRIVYKISFKTFKNNIANTDGLLDHDRENAPNGNPRVNGPFAYCIDKAKYNNLLEEFRLTPKK